MLSVTTVPISRTGTVSERVSQLEDAYDHLRKDVALLRENIFSLFSITRENTDELIKVFEILRDSSLWDPANE